MGPIPFMECFRSLWIGWHISAEIGLKIHFRFKIELLVPGNHPFSQKGDWYH